MSVNWKIDVHPCATYCQEQEKKKSCWAYTPRKPELKETHVPQCSLQHFLQKLGHGRNLDVHQQMNG